MTEAQLTEARASQAPTSSQPGSVRRGISRSRWLLVVAALSLFVAAALFALWCNFRDRQTDPFQAALAAVDREDLAVARQYLAELRSSGKHHSQATLLRGAMLLKKGYYYPALDELQEVADHADLKISALKLIGQAWYHLGRHVEAQAALHKVLREEPNAVEAHRWLAASYYDLGANHDALHHLKRTADLDPSDHRPHRLLGLIYKDYERYGDAAACYEESLRRKDGQPDWVDVRQELAVCQQKLWRFRDALATLAPCPATVEVSVVRAQCQHALGDVPSAKESLAAVLYQDQANLDALVLQGTILLEEGKTPAAVDVFRRATQAHPKDYLAHFKLAQAYTQLGQQDRGNAEQKLADQIREVRKEFADLHQVAWDRPHDVQVRLRLAALAKELDRPDLADVWLRSAAALQPLATPKPYGPQPDATNRNDK
ncbi:MAG: tetratricopeptide repeat protein [Planctomycetaceae bacterium]|nr:tetratricopeptide repeat protein [Planctomycetaceae bacterium]